MRHLDLYQSMLLFLPGSNFFGKRSPRRTHSIFTPTFTPMKRGQLRLDCSQNSNSSQCPHPCQRGFGNFVRWYDSPTRRAQ
ncbi:late endosome to vacuole transport-related [Moniliophthora roreri]|nr:late endosome to vacuole transport-related [Moniliophthora roreri]